MVGGAAHGREYRSHAVSLKTIGGSCRDIPEPKQITTTTMKKLILIAAAIVTTLGVGYAANSLHNIADHSKCEMGMKCSFCNGTGWKGNFKCFQCKGTGANGEY